MPTGNIPEVIESLGGAKHVNYLARGYFWKGIRKRQLSERPQAYMSSIECRLA